MRLGLLGGSFNPPHACHLALARAAAQTHALDNVLLIPAASPPHKRSGLAPAVDRLAMVRLAIAGEAGMEASDIELRRAGRSYTYVTLDELHQLHPGVTLFFILGGDSLRDLPSWRQPDRILSLCRIVAIDRPGVEVQLEPTDFPATCRAALQQLARDRVPMEPCPLSSTAIRERLRQGETVDEQVPAAVLAYIREHGLYST